MYWTEVKSALLHGTPTMRQDKVQPQAVQIAVREISRLIDFGWIDDMTDDVLQRIQDACQVGQCQELWEEINLKCQLLLKKRSGLRRARQHKTSKKKGESVSLN
ncbi:hypothetical protein U27_00424 [Candidatus Vecturithrix granuli]|uniref:Uncharacterized protein n=1 Tax=Vecturithrix granuli TaxID=1499967 RepID=A0A081C7H2_VECG1|nr:hypothetical protein U27_00424 [Candidatus Vecturithrix granuli]